MDGNKPRVTPPARWYRQWWGVAAVGLAVVSVGYIAAVLIFFRDSGTSRSSTARNATTPRLNVSPSSLPSTATSPTVPQPTVPPSSALPSSAACGDRQAFNAPAPSGSDDTAALANFFASHPAGCIAFPANATYELDSTLTITGASDLEIHGNGATLAATTQGDRDRQHVVLDKGSRVTVDNLGVRGANQQHLGSYGPLIFQHGFEVFSSTDIRLINLHVDEVYGDAIYIGGTGTGNVVVQGGSFSYTGRQGIAVTEGNGVVLADFTLREAGRFCVDLEANVGRPVIDRVSILNTNSTCRMGWLVVHESVSGVLSQGNVANGNPAPSGKLSTGVY